MVFHAIDPRFHPGCETTLGDYETEVHRQATDHRRQDLDYGEAR